jgi:hypothetical protein
VATRKTLAAERDEHSRFPTHYRYNIRSIGHDGLTSTLSKNGARPKRCVSRDRVVIRTLTSHFDRHTVYAPCTGAFRFWRSALPRAARKRPRPVKVFSLPWRAATPLLSPSLIAHCMLLGNAILHGRSATTALVSQYCLSICDRNGQQHSSIHVQDTQLQRIYRRSERRKSEAALQTPPMRMKGGCAASRSTSSSKSVGQRQQSACLGSERGTANSQQKNARHQGHDRAQHRTSTPRTYLGRGRAGRKKRAHPSV